MSLTLTTFASGANINATTLRANLAATELYLNEGTIAADRGSAWMQANHVYRPDFFGSPNPHTTLTSGESYFRQRGVQDRDRAFFSYQTGTAPIPIPGMQATIQIPESLSVGTFNYRILVAASMYIYEYGGDDGPMDEDSRLAATVGLSVNGVIAAGTIANIYKGSQTYATQVYPYYPRKQTSLVFAFNGTSTQFNVGLNNVGMVVSNFVPGVTSPPYWKHVICCQGSFLCRYWLR